MSLLASTGTGTSANAANKRYFQFTVYYVFVLDLKTLNAHVNSSTDVMFPVDCAW